MQTIGVCYRNNQEGWATGKKLNTLDLGGSAGFPHGCHQFLVPGNQITPELCSHDWVRQLIGRMAAPLNGFLQILEKRDAGLASFHVLFKFFAQRFI
jgi:hypothetical protein